LGRYELGWATLEIMRTFCKNRRNYRKKIGYPTRDTDNDGMDDGSDEEPEVMDFSDSDDGGTTSAGKRKMVAAGGTRKKART